MPDPDVAAVRAFNRFYTRQLGLLSDHLLDSPFSLTEARVLYELAHGNQPTASEIARDLGLDAGYLSRILLKFHKRRLLSRKRSASDARQSHLSLTRLGREAFAPLDQEASKQVAGLLHPLPAAERTRLVDAMRSIQRVLSAPAAESPYNLRTHRPGDIGWVIHRHGALYVAEQGWDERFEALVAKIAAGFIENFDPRRERCWIVEQDSTNVGCVFLARGDDTTARLRLLLIEPSARGHGLGRRLVDECIGFAREAGYRTITLWTQAHLSAARRLYQQAGFHCAAQEKHRLFGPEMVGETWEMQL